MYASTLFLAILKANEIFFFCKLDLESYYQNSRIYKNTVVFPTCVSLSNFCVYVIVFTIKVGKQSALFTKGRDCCLQLQTAAKTVIVYSCIPFLQICFSAFFELCTRVWTGCVTCLGEMLKMLFFGKCEWNSN